MIIKKNPQLLLMYVGTPDQSELALFAEMYVVILRKEPCTSHAK